jgi:hypothetical protein
MTVSFYLIDINFDILKGFRDIYVKLIKEYNFITKIPTCRQLTKVKLDDNENSESKCPKSEKESFKQLTTS